MIQADALQAARDKRPLPVGYKLPQLTDETRLVYEAIRSGEDIESISAVSDVVVPLIINVEFLIPEPSSLI